MGDTCKILYEAVALKILYWLLKLSFRLSEDHRKCYGSIENTRLPLNVP